MSKFKGLFDVTKPDTRSLDKQTVDKQEQLPEQEPSNSSTTTKPRNRSLGKRTDPAYEQVTAYIRKDTYKQVKIALIQEGEGQDFSQLVEQLLGKWLKPRS